MGPEAFAPLAVRVEANAVPVEGGLVLEADVTVFTTERLLTSMRAHVRLQTRGCQILAATHRANVQLFVDVNSQHMLVNVVFGIVSIDINHNPSMNINLTMNLCPALVYI